MRVTTTGWDEYWGEYGRFGNELAQLKEAWTALIASGFASDLRRDFVRSYFLLLRACLDCHASCQDVFPVLRKVVGFETIRVSGDCGGSAAGVVSARHPVYLLGRLASPNAAENPKYLPLVCPCGDTRERHLRRFALHGVSVVDLTSQTKRRGAAVYLIERKPPERTGVNRTELKTEH